MVAVAGFAGSASAAVTGLVQSSTATALDSVNKSATVTCPAGKQVLGPAARVGGVGQVVLHNIRPSADLKSVVVQGLEDENGTTAPWALTAIAICATPPPGLQRVAATSVSDSLDKEATATCPSGKKLLGVGGEISGGGGEVALNDVIPVSGLQSAIVRAAEDQNGTSANWSVTAFAVCANPVAGLQRVLATSPSNSSSKSMAIACPAATQAVGAGGELAGDGGQVVMTSISPNLALTNVTDIGSEDEDGTTNNWTVRSFAICANSAQRVVATSTNDSLDKSAFAGICSGGKRPTGGGGDIRSRVAAAPIPTPTGARPRTARPASEWSAQRHS